MNSPILTLPSSSISSKSESDKGIVEFAIPSTRICASTSSVNSPSKVLAPVGPPSEDGKNVFFV